MAILLIFVGVLFLGVLIVLGILFLNEKTIVVPDDFLTIQKAVDDADPGDIILVKATGGPYTENVTITTEDIKLIGIGKEKTILDGETSDSNVMKGNIVNENGTHGISLSESNSNMMKGNKFNENNTDGILLIRSVSNTMKGNTVNDNGDDGIQLFHLSNNNIIKGNTVNDNVGDGVTFSADSNDNDVFFNRAFGNTIDINDQNVAAPPNNFKGNKCDTSFPPVGICN